MIKKEGERIEKRGRERGSLWKGMSKKGDRDSLERIEKRRGRGVAFGKE